MKAPTRVHVESFTKCEQNEKFKENEVKEGMRRWVVVFGVEGGG